MVYKMSNTSSKSSNGNNGNNSVTFQREKLVMNIAGEQDKIEIVDRFNVWMIKSKRFKTKSDGIAALLKYALDGLEKTDNIDEHLTPPPTRPPRTRKQKAVTVATTMSTGKPITSTE